MGSSNDNNVKGDGEGKRKGKELKWLSKREGRRTVQTKNDLPTAPGDMHNGDEDKVIEPDPPLSNSPPGIGVRLHRLLILLLQE